MALYAREAEIRGQLLTSEDIEAPWKSAWRPGMMYVLIVLWVWALIGQPALDTWGPSVAPVPLDTLMSLTVLYLGLYMGGHTVRRSPRSWGSDVGLDGDGITIASQTALIFVLCTLAVRVLRAEVDGVIALAAGRHGLTLAIAFAAAALAIERSFYIVARLSRKDGVDLYALHPAP